MTLVTPPGKWKVLVTSTLGQTWKFRLARNPSTSAGRGTPCAIISKPVSRAGQLKCWGSAGSFASSGGNFGDAPGEMGDNLAYVNLGGVAKRVVGGYGANLAIVDIGGDVLRTTQGSGVYNSYCNCHSGIGQALASDDVPVGLATAAHARCVLTAAGKVKCFGHAEAYGLLGGPSSSINIDSGQAPITVDLGTGKQADAVSAIAAGNHFCARLIGGGVKCWGRNHVGQLGQGDTTSRGNSAGQMGDNLPSIDFGTGRTAVQISVGSDHGCAILDNSELKCWCVAVISAHCSPVSDTKRMCLPHRGGNSQGQLGLGHSNNVGDGSGEMGDSLPAVDLGTGKTAIKVYAGTQTTCATLNTLELKCWGSNSQGQLGQGHTNSLGDDANEMGDNLPVVPLNLS